MTGEGNTYLHPNLPADASDAVLSQALLVRSSSIFPSIAWMAAIPQRQLKCMAFFLWERSFWKETWSLSSRSQNVHQIQHWISLGPEGLQVWLVLTLLVPGSPFPAHGVLPDAWGWAWPSAPWPSCTCLGQWNRLWPWHGCLTDKRFSTSWNSSFNMHHLWYMLQPGHIINPKISFVKPLRFTPCK